MMRFLTVLCALIGMVAVTMPAMAEKNTKTDLAAEASSFVNNVASEAIKIIDEKHAGNLTEQQAKTQFRKILNDAFDLDTIARFTMGRYWRVATAEEKKEYVRLLQVKILDKYADAILSYSGAGHKMNSSSALSDTDYNVDMTIIRKGEPPVDMGWRLRQTGGKFRVVDISVEGISMSVTHRSDFASVIERNGGKVQALLDALKQKEGDVVKTTK